MNIALKAAAAAALVALAGAGIQTWRLAAVRGELADERLARAEEGRRHEAAARSAAERFRALETDMNRRLKEAQDAAVPKRAAVARAAAADAVALGDGLRVDLAQFAAGGGDAAGDTLPACRARAAELADAVDEGLRLQAEMAADFAALAVDYGVLHGGWPGGASGSRGDRAAGSRGAGEVADGQ